MAKKPPELGPLAVSRLSEEGFHFVGGVAGLALQVTAAGSRSWVFRAMMGGRRRDMGLGGYPDVTLAGAKEAARAARAKIKQGIDPIEEAKAAKSALVASRAKDVTFERCAAMYIETHEKGWKNAKHRAQWASTLATYAYPHFGSLLVRDVELPHILAALEPIWATKTETASRLRGRIESVINLAIARGYRTGLNPARWTGHLDLMLASPAKIAKEEHYPAVPAAQVGAFMARLAVNRCWPLLRLQPSPRCSTQDHFAPHTVIEYSTTRRGNPTAASGSTPSWLRVPPAAATLTA